ncbi:VanZ family protein [Agrococcus sp. HG114]|uniref:VanZ family protein n=1 Tax=Agrococcus sp. HG114 TaxID=2969757 RepID=UPI00215A5A42|nr:VanZ family protein [Agrococcus sp. HG114]MCR8670436.1 VanZ family protein [Agrococcus sp. HG114]
MGSTGWRRVALALFAVAVLAQLLVLYAPDPPEGLPGAPGLDKLVHAAVFLAPALLGVLAGMQPLWLGAALVAHALLSELIQHSLLAARSGDGWDAVADVVGVAAGLAAGWALRRRAAHSAAA